MKVCLVSVEYFAWGAYAGFGAATRKLGTELAKRGVEVEAFITTSDPSKRVPVGKYELIDGVKVKTLPRLRYKLFYGDCYKTDADIIHSESGPIDTWFAFRNNAKVPKLITVQDLRSYQERKRLYRLGAEARSIEWGIPEAKHIPVSWVTWHTAKLNVHRADLVTCQAHLLEPKIRSIFKYSKHVGYLPNFVDVPNSLGKKTDNPSVVWLARLDYVKRADLMFRLAELAPNVDFYVCGKSHYPKLNSYYEAKYGSGKVPNVFLMGHQDEQGKRNLLQKSWVLLNTSFYEALPVSFIEALAYGCALLSTQNSDAYTEKFGYYDSTMTAQGLLKGLRSLLKSDEWKTKGNLGYEFVKQSHNTEIEIKRHIQLYRRMTE